MSSLSIPPVANLRGESSSYVSGSVIHLRKGLLGAGQWKGPPNQVTGVWLKHLGRSTTRNGCRFSVVARNKKGQKHEYPWPENIDPNLESGHLSYLSHFKPLKEKPKLVTLEFEKPLIEPEKKIADLE